MGSGAPIDPGVGRLLEANANRVREGLRVMEDVARFCWNDESLAGGLKTLRHDLARALETLEAATGELLRFRDTPGDVGTAQTDPAETTRESVTALFHANAKRAQEGLRGLEEGSKLAPDFVAEENPFKALRYRVYTLESEGAQERQP